MEFILNSRSKKVEIFYESVEEQQAILNLISKHLTYKEDNTPREIYINNNPGITWAATPDWIVSTTDNSTSTITLDSASLTNAVQLTDKTIDINSDESDYSCLTASVPRKTK